MDPCWRGGAEAGARLARAVLLLFPVYALGYLQLGLTWLLLGVALALLWRQNARRKRARTERALLEGSGVAHGAELQHLPAWVHFPDVERVEWLNKTVNQMWPYVCQIVERFFRENIEPVVKESNPHLNTFNFTKIDLGDKPVRINGVKVYTENVDKRQIILDLQISFVANTDIDVEIKRYYCRAGIKSVQLHGMLRVVLEPLLGDLPFIGAFSLFFLKRPLLDISWTGLTNMLDIPGLSGVSEHLIQDVIYSYMVLPNRVTIPLVQEAELTHLHFPMPKGVLRVHFLEAQDLVGKDKFLMGLIKGKSDPYGVLQVANQHFQSKTIKETLNPKWNEVFEAMIYEHSGQHLEIELFDEDPDKDDFLGSLMIDLTELHKEQKVDEWFDVEEVSSGKLHLRLEWLSLSTDRDKLDQVLWNIRCNESLSSALLVVYLDSAKNLPAGRKVNSSPSPYVQCTVGQHTHHSKVRYKTCEPVWDETFSFLLQNPHTQELQLEVRDHKHKSMLGKVQVALSSLLVEQDMSLTQQLPLTHSSPNTSIALKMALRILWLEKETASSKPSSVQIRRISHSAATTSTPPSQMGIAPPTAPATPPPPNPAPCPTPPSRVPAPRQTAAPQGRRDSRDSPVRSSSTSGLNAVCGRGSHQDSTPSLASDSSLPSTQLQHTLAHTHNGSAARALGEVQLTIRHSSQRNKLIVVVHACRNLVCVGREVLEPYIRLYLLPDKSRSGRKKTSTMKKTTNPVYDQSFEFIVSVVELHRRNLDVAVKNGGGMLSKNRGLLGKVLVNLVNEDISKGWTQWYELASEGY